MWGVPSHKIGIKSIQAMEENIEMADFGILDSSMPTIWVVSGLIAVIALYLTWRFKASKYRYPPSPPGYNIFKGGHAHLLPPGLEVWLPRVRF